VVHLRLSNLYGLMAIIAVAWLLIIGESYFFVAVVRPLGPPIHVGSIPSTAVKVLLTAGLGAVWIASMFLMDSLYWRLTKTPTSPSVSRTPS
jgi:hypothetical protein